MMFVAVPPLIVVVETTTESRGETLREAMVCRAVTIAAPHTIGSRDSCGRGARLLAYDPDQVVIGGRQQRSRTRTDDADLVLRPAVQPVDPLHAGPAVRR